MRNNMTVFRCCVSVLIKKSLLKNRFRRIRLRFREPRMKNVRRRAAIHLKTILNEIIFAAVDESRACLYHDGDII